jgi:phosphatidate cytidylyltransferase
MTAARVLTALVLIPVVVGLVWWGSPALLAVVATIVLLLALYEFFRLAERAGLRGYWRWTSLCAAGLVYAQWEAGQVETHPLTGGLELVRNAGRANLSIESVFVIFLLGVAWIAVVGRRPIMEILPGAGTSATAMVFIALPFSYLVRIDGAAPPANDHLGKQLVLFTLALIWAGDTAAYFVGRSFGHVPMAPALSPKKTWEGAAGNVIASLVVAVPFARWMDADLFPLLLAALFTNIAGQLGDLFESAYKRAASAKDSGTLLPGHGGMLDRIDSLIFAAPVMWCYVGWWFWRGHG